MLHRLRRITWFLLEIGLGLKLSWPLFENSVTDVEKEKGHVTRRAFSLFGVFGMSLNDFRGK